MGNRKMPSLSPRLICPHCGEEGKLIVFQREHAYYDLIDVYDGYIEIGSPIDKYWSCIESHIECEACEEKMGPGDVAKANRRIARDDALTEEEEK